MDLESLKNLKDKQRQDEIATRRHAEQQEQLFNVQETIVRSFNTLVDYLDAKVTRTEVVNQLKEIGTPDAYEVVRAVQELDNTIQNKPNVDLTEVTELLREVAKQTSEIPKEHQEIEIPEQKFVDYSNQLVDLKQIVENVVDAIKSQKTTVEAPVVNVPETVVNVPETDLKPIEKGLKSVETAIGNIELPKTDVSGVEKKLDRSNKLLKEIVDKPVGGGGGGGSSWVAVNQDGIAQPITLTVDGKIPVEAGATSNYESRNDITTDTNLVYLGKALPGSLEGDAAWQIKRYNKSAGHMSFADDVTTFTKKWSERTLYGY